MNGMYLMVVAMGILVLPGALYNNMFNSGLVVSQTQAIGNCDNNLDICQITGNVGCQANTNYCTLNGQTASFLNGNSPFTQLLQGNLFALFTNLNPLFQSSTGSAQTSWSGTHGPFDITGNPIYYSADCQGSTNAGLGNSRSQVNWGVGRCTQTNTDNSNVTEANVATWNNWNTQWNSTVALQFYQLGNGTYQRTCTWIAQINYTALGNSGYTYFGCNVAAGTNQAPGATPTHRDWGYLVAMPVSYGIMPSGASHQSLFVQLLSWWPNGCVPNSNLFLFSSSNCNQFQQGFKGVAIPGTGLTFVPNSAGAVVFGFLAGIILLIGGLGLQVGVGGGVSAGVNPQGTKLFQVLGLGLITWSFLFSEFSTWFSSGNLPYGLDGMFGLVGATITGVFFFGSYTWATSGGGINDS